MMPKLRRDLSLLIIVSLSLFYLGSNLGAKIARASRKGIPSLSFFLNMPYDTVVSGKTPGLEEPPEELPALDRGEIAVFFLTNTNEMKIILPQKEYSFKLSRPEKSLSMDIFMGKQGVDILQGKKIFSTSVREQANIALKEDQFTYDTVKGEVSIEMLKVQRRESMVSKKADIQTKESNVGVKVEDVKNVNVKVKESGIAIKEEVSAVDVVTISSEVIIEEQEASAADVITISSGVTIEKQDAGVQINFGAEESVQMKASEDQSGDVSTAVVFSAPQVAGSSELGGALVDEASLMGLFDESLVAYFAGENYLSGFNDAGELAAFSGSKIMEGKWDQAQYVPDLEERNAFKKLIISEPKMMQLLDRPFSRVFREDPSAKGENYQCDISFEFIPTEKYHGHPVGAMVSIMNSGDAYMYDAMIVWGIPQHSKFLEFYEKDTYSKGFSGHYLEDSNLVLLKLYRPIAPGETFKALVFFTLDPWSFKNN